MHTQASPAGQALASLLYLATLAPPCFATDSGIADFEVRAARNGETFDVEASAEFEAGLELAWAALTDYDRLAEFIPGMHESRVVSRSHNAVVVDQSGEASLLFFSFPIQVRLAIEERPFEQIDSRAIDGNFRELVGSYHLEARGSRVRLRYAGRMTPDFAIPPLIGTLLVRNTAARRFRAMVEEIVRRQHERDGLQPARPAAPR